AHTPDALENVLTTARKLLRPGARLGVVFGCGGDRDRGKRPIMGGIAARLADRAWVTSDNPRSERPEAILAEIETGIPAEASRRHQSIAHRRRAIQSAVAWASGGDVVVIAGKGHETYQVVGGTTLPFDDREGARAALVERGGPPGGLGAPSTRRCPRPSGRSRAPRSWSGAGPEATCGAAEPGRHRPRHPGRPGGGRPRPPGDPRHDRPPPPPLSRSG